MTDKEVRKCRRGHNKAIMTNGKWRCTPCSRLKRSRLAAKLASINGRAHHKYGAPGSISTIEAQAVIDEFEGRCAYCQLAPFRDLDHVMPLSRGGTNFITNILPACLLCNRRKGTKTLEEWCPELAVWFAKRELPPNCVKGGNNSRYQLYSLEDAYSCVE